MSRVYKNLKASTFDETLKNMSSSKGLLTKDSRLEKKQSFRSSSKNNHNQQKDSSGKENLDRNLESFSKTRTVKGNNVAESTQILDPKDNTSSLIVIENRLNRPELLKLFDRFGIFSHKHRALIWKFLLGLPSNKEHFDRLVSQGTHIAYQDLERTFSIPAKDLLLKLQRILSCLAHYSPVFSEVEYLPDLVYPFVKLFANDELMCFEIIVSFFFQWGQYFFEYFPNPAVSVIQAAEEILKHYEFGLYSYFKKLGLNMVDYGWPFLKSLFTTILARDDWLSWMDFLVIYNQEPNYLVFFIVAYLSYFKDPLMKVESQEDIDSFLEKQNPVNIQTIIKDMRYYKKNTPASQITIKFQNNLPLNEDEYPIFNFYPEYAVEHHRRLREQFLTEERKLELKKQSIKQIQSLTDELLDQERKFRDKQEALVKAQNNRKGALMLEEERRLKQKLTLETESREKRIVQLQNLEQSIKASLEQQDRLANQELQALQKELELQSRVDRQLIQARLEEEALMNAEFQATQRLNEVSELRNTEERARKIRTEIDYVQRQNKLKDRIWEENLRAEDEEFKRKTEALRQKKLAELNIQQEINDKKELELQLLNEAFKKELKHQDVERERKLRSIAHEGVLENEEYIKFSKMREEKFRAEDEKYMKTLFDEENRRGIKRSEEKLNQIEQEKRFLKNELENYEQTLKDRSIHQKRDEIANRISAIQRDKESKFLEEEKDLQNLALTIEEQRNIQREMQKNMFNKEKEYQGRLKEYRTLRQRDEDMTNEERGKFSNYREAFREELNKIEEVREKMTEARISQIQKQNEELVHQNTEELRKKIQTENMLKYFDGMKKKEEEEEEESESESESSFREEDQRSFQSRGQDYRVEDSRRRGHESQRTGAFQSQEESADKYGRSISSYTYSDAENRDETRRFKSGISEAQDIISRHQNMRSYDEPDSRYYGNQYRDYQTSKDQYTSNSRADDYGSEGESQGRYYKDSMHDRTRSHQLQSSPDNNLTYSSYEGSFQ